MQPITIKLEDPALAQERKPSKPSAPTVMELKLFWSLLGASLSCTAAVIPWLLGTDWRAAATGLAIVTVVLLTFAARAVHFVDMFRPLDWTIRNRITLFVRLGIGAYALLAMLFTLNPHQWPALVFALIVTVICVYCGARGVEYWMARAKPKQKPVEPVPDIEYADRDTAQRMRTIVDRAGHQRVKITRHTVVLDENGNKEANQFVLQTPASGTGK